MSENTTVRKVPYHEPGEIEKRVRNIHIFLGLFLMGVQFLVLSIEDWLFTTGLVPPIFIIIVGIVYGLGSSKESDQLFLDNVIKPRVDAITDEQTIDYLHFRNALRVSVLAMGYLGTAILTLIWVTLTRMGSTSLLPLMILFPMFALFIPTSVTPISMVLERTRYKNIQPLLQAERDFLKTLKL